MPTSPEGLTLEKTEYLPRPSESYPETPTIDYLRAEFGITEPFDFTSAAAKLRQKRDQKLDLALEEIAPEELVTLNRRRSELAEFKQKRQTVLNQAPLKLKAERQKVILLLAAKGIKHPERLLEQLEVIHCHWTSGEKRDLEAISNLYRDLTRPDYAHYYLDHMRSIPNLSLAFDRLIELDQDFYQQATNFRDQKAFLTELGGLSPDYFKKLKETVAKYPSLLTSPIFPELFQAITKQGGLTPLQKNFLASHQQITRLCGSGWYGDNELLSNDGLRKLFTTPNDPSNVVLLQQIQQSLKVARSVAREAYLPEKYSNIFDDFRRIYGRELRQVLQRLSSKNPHLLHALASQIDRGFIAEFSALPHDSTGGETHLIRELEQSNRFYNLSTNPNLSPEARLAIDIAYSIHGENLLNLNSLVFNAHILEDPNRQMLSKLTKLTTYLFSEPKDRRAWLIYMLQQGYNQLTDTYRFFNFQQLKDSFDQVGSDKLAQLPPEFLPIVELVSKKTPYWEFSSNKLLMQYALLYPDRYQQLTQGQLTMNSLSEVIDFIKAYCPEGYKSGHIDQNQLVVLFGRFLSPGTSPSEIRSLATFYAGFNPNLQSVILHNPASWVEFVEGGKLQKSFFEEALTWGPGTVISSVEYGEMDETTCPDSFLPVYHVFKNMDSSTGKHLIAEYPDLWSEFVSSGQLTKVFFQKALEESWVSLQDVLPLMTPKVMANWEEPVRKYWLTIKSLSPRLLQILLTSAGYIDLMKKFSVENISDSDIESLAHTTELLDSIQSSPSKEIQRFALNLLPLLLSSANPAVDLEKIKNVFERNNLPEVGKIFRCFEILYPPDRLDKTLKEKFHLSPMLTTPSLASESPLRIARGRYSIILKDLLDIEIDSSNPSLYNYISALREGGFVFDKVRLLGESSLSPTEREKLIRFLNRMDTLYENSRLGRSMNLPSTQDLPLNRRLSRLTENFRLRKGQTLTQRVFEMFVAPSGYSSLDQVLGRMETVKTQADARNRALISSAHSPDLPLSIGTGDCLKGVDMEYLPQILSSGALAREYLGAASDSDATPFDTDTETVFDSDIVDGKINLAQFLETLQARKYGNIMLLIKDRGQFSDSQTKDPNAKTIYERFPSRVVSSRHFGIRTGIAGSEISGIILHAFEEKSVSQEILDRLFMDISLNGFYVPVVDKNGKLLFTPEQFDEYQIKSRSVAHSLNKESFNPKSLIDALSESKFLSGIFEMDSGVSEGYTLRTHTEMVLSQFEKYFTPEWHGLEISKLLDRNSFRLLLALHDIGKPESFRRRGGTQAQHEYTSKYAPKILEQLGLHPQKAEVIAGIISKDLLGAYIFRGENMETTASSIKKQSEELGISRTDLVELLRIYYMCDGSSYTTDAGAHDSSGSVFTFSEENGQRVIKLSPLAEEKYTQLKEYLLSI